MKKLFTLVLALALVMSLAISASADTITINGAPENSVYNAYQLLNLSTGLKKEGCHATDAEHSSDCYNFAYTVNSKYSEILKEVSGKTTDDDVITYIGAMSTDSDAIRTFADAVYAAIKAAGLEADMTTTDGTFKDSAQGYWLIEEANPGDATDYSLVMLTTMGIRDITINTKRDELDLDKYIYHDDENSWSIVGDNQIGETVDFHTKSLVPDTDGFNELYIYVIHDKFSDGLTSNVVTGNTNSALSVTVNYPDTNTSAKIVDAKYYDVYDSTYTGDIVLGTYTEDGEEKTVKLNCTNGCDFHVVFDIRAGLAAGVFDDDDTLYVNYTAVLNENAKVYQTASERENNQAHLEYSNNPYDEDEVRKTPVSEVYDYTFRLEVKKTDESTGEEISGAKFVMSNEGTLTDNGAVIDPEEDADDLIKFIYNSTDDTYTIMPADFDEADLAEDESLTYVIAAGSPVIKGLNDEEDYYLYEIEAPAGYNALTAPVRVKIFTKYNSSTGEMLEGYPQVQVDSKQKSTDMTVEITNNSGTVMPSTGGVGTTMFYIIGATMAAAALVLLVTKKRMAA